MAYTKTTWVNDQAPDIDADNLNKMEEGIANAQYPDNGEQGQILALGANGEKVWVDKPTSAIWGNIEGDIEDQIDLEARFATKMTTPAGGTAGQVLTKTATGQAWQDASGGGGNVDTVNGFSPDANKNVQVSESITEAGYEALSTTEKNSEREYFVSDGDVPYATGEDIPVSSTDSTPVSDAIEDLKSGLKPITQELTMATYNVLGAGTAIKLGSLVIVKVYFRAVNTLSQTSLIATVPEGFRPPSTAQSVLTLYSSSIGKYGYVGYMSLNSEGNIYQTITNSMPANAEVEATYIYNVS